MESELGQAQAWPWALVQGLLLFALAGALWWWLRRQSGTLNLARGAGRMLCLRERVALDARHALHLVQVGEQILLIGVGPQDAPRVLARYAEDALKHPTQPPPSPTRFATLLTQWRQRGAQVPAESGAEDGPTKRTSSA
ncbi:MAG: flagellar biosynthetic protein FliO [Polyangiales bacterium]